MFDSCLVILMLMETVVFTAVQLMDGSAISANVSFLRLFRLVRLTRLLRLYRLLTLPEFMILIKGMVTAIKSVVYVMLLLLLVTYVFAIALTQMSDGTEFREKYFRHVCLSMYSLLLYATFLDNLSEFTDAIRAESSFCFIIVLIFIALASLTVMNMLIGVLCEIVQSVARKEKQDIIAQTVEKKFDSIIAEADTDFNGSVSIMEFRRIFEMPEALRALSSVGVDPEGMLDFAEELFSKDGEAIELPFKDFIAIILDLRGTQPATVKDMMSLGKSLRKKLQESKSEIDQLKDSLDILEMRLDEALSIQDAQNSKKAQVDLME
jgi:hypothetical protein